MRTAVVLQDRALWTEKYEPQIPTISWRLDEDVHHPLKSIITRGGWACHLCHISCTDAAAFDSRCKKQRSWSKDCPSKHFCGCQAVVWHSRIVYNGAIGHFRWHGVTIRKIWNVSEACELKPINTEVLPSPKKQRETGVVYEVTLCYVNFSNSNVFTYFFFVLYCEDMTQQETTSSVQAPVIYAGEQKRKVLEV